MDTSFNREIPRRFRVVSVFNVLCGDVQLLFGSCNHHLLVLLTKLPSNQTCNVREQTRHNIRQRVAKLSTLPNGGHPLGSFCGNPMGS